MKQFRNERALFSFLGLTPSEYSSGDTVRRGRITRQGRPIIRSVLIEAAWRAIRDDPSLKIAYTRIKLRRGANRAIVGIARKLMGRIRACFVKGCTYKIAEA